MVPAVVTLIQVTEQGFFFKFLNGPFSIVKPVAVFVSLNNGGLLF